MPCHIVYCRPGTVFPLANKGKICYYYKNPIDKIRGFGTERRTVITNTNPQIRIIVSVYKVEEYRIPYPDKFITQTDENLEILPIDNGSNKVFDTYT